MTFEDMLSAVAQQGLPAADPRILRAIAEQLWYEDAIPDLSKVEVPLRNDAGYLIDILVRFKVLPKAQKLAVIAALEPFKPAQPTIHPACKDPRALAWGAHADLTRRLPELLPYQTRQYAATRKKSGAK